MYGLTGTRFVALLLCLFATSLYYIPCFFIQSAMAAEFVAPKISQACIPEPLTGRQICGKVQIPGGQNKYAQIDEFNSSSLDLPYRPQLSTVTSYEDGQALLGADGTVLTILSPSCAFNGGESLRIPQMVFSNVFNPQQSTVSAHCVREASLSEFEGLLSYENLVQAVSVRENPDSSTVITPTLRGVIRRGADGTMTASGIASPSISLSDDTLTDAVTQFSVVYTITNKSVTAADLYVEVSTFTSATPISLSVNCAYRFQTKTDAQQGDSFGPIQLLYHSQPLVLRQPGYNGGTATAFSGNEVRLFENSSSYISVSEAACGDLRVSARRALLAAASSAGLPTSLSSCGHDITVEMTGASSNDIWATSSSDDSSDKCGSVVSESLMSFAVARQGSVDFPQWCIVGWRWHVAVSTASLNGAAVNSGIQFIDVSPPASVEVFGLPPPQRIDMTPWSPFI